MLSDPTERPDNGVELLRPRWMGPAACTTATTGFPRRATDAPAWASPPLPYRSTYFSSGSPSRSFSSRYTSSR